MPGPVLAYRPDGPIIDTHAHIISKAAPFAPTAWTRPDYEYLVDDYLADLDAHGIAFGLVSAASLYDDYNDYVLDALASHKRLRGTARVKPDIDPATLEYYATHGIVGIRFQWGQKALPDLNGHDYQKLFYRMGRLGLHAQLNASGPRLADILAALRPSGVRVVIDHYALLRAETGLSCPGFAAALDAAREGWAWIRLSGDFRMPAYRAESYAAALLDALPPERLFWGSDAPFVGHEQTATFGRAVDSFFTVFPDGETRRRINDAALRFYFF